MRGAGETHIAWDQSDGASGREWAQRRGERSAAQCSAVQWGTTRRLHITDAILECGAAAWLLGLGLFALAVGSASE